MLQSNNHWRAEELVALACLSSLALLPFFIPLEFHDSQRILTVLFATLIVISRIWRTSWNKSTLTVLSALSVLAITISLHSPAPLWSTLEFSLLWTFLVAPFVLFHSVDEQLIRRLASIMVLVQAGYILRDLWNYYGILLNGYPLHAIAIIDGFSNMRFYSQFLVWTMPFCIAVLASCKPQTAVRIIFVGMLALGWAMIGISGARNFFPAMLGSLLLTAWLTPSQWKHYTRWVLATAAIGLLIYCLLAFVLPNHLHSPEPGTLATYSINRDLTDPKGRFAIWTHALQQAAQHPWFGIGPMMTAEQDFFKTEAHPHNYLIQLMTEWGIPFTLLVSGIAGYQLLRWKRAIQANPAEREMLALPAAAAIGAASIAALFDGLLVMPVSLTYMALILGVAVGLQKTGAAPSPQIPAWGSAVLLLPPLFLASVTVHQATQILSKPYIPASTTRFWSDGAIHITRPFAKTYAMGGASDSYALATLRLAVELYPQIRNSPCQLYMGANGKHPQDKRLPAPPDMTIDCGSQREYVLVDYQGKQIDVYQIDPAPPSWAVKHFGQQDMLTLPPPLHTQIPVGKLFGADAIL